jgi:hypothetical protein
MNEIKRFEDTRVMSEAGTIRWDTRWDVDDGGMWMKLCTVRFYWVHLLDLTDFLCMFIISMFPH